MTVKRMDNVGIVVADIDAAIEFFTGLGLALEGRMPIEGEWGESHGTQALRTQALASNNRLQRTVRCCRSRGTRLNC